MMATLMYHLADHGLLLPLVGVVGKVRVGGLTEQRDACHRHVAT